MVCWVAFFVILLPLLCYQPGMAASAWAAAGDTVPSNSNSMRRAVARPELAMAAPPNLATMIKGGTAPVQVGDMVYVPGGYFIMGDHRGRPDERPVHSVRLSPYYIDVFEVANAEYKEFVDATGHAFPHLPAEASAERLLVPDVWDHRLSSISLHWAWSDGAPPAGLDDHPVVLVSWEDAAAFCAWRGKRLPTEAEWEMAARGSDRRAFPWGNEWDVSFANSAERWAEAGQLTEEEGRSWWRGDGAELAGRQKLTFPVGSFPDGRSSCGVYNMAGNVAEWVADWYDAAYYGKGLEKDPKGPGAGDLRVVRGGSWFSVGSDLRVTARQAIDPSVWSFLIGFRCAKDGE